jgi:CRISPR/Cas system CMR subunit Cmr4 (Cas7 group RAMP superfamily)
LLERHDRDRRSLGLESIAEGLAEQLGSFEGGALVSADELAGRTLVLEDLVYTAAEVRSGGLATLAAGAFAKLLPKTEQRARARLVDSLVVISDAELQDLVERTVPVIARVKLTEGKTTSDFIREDGTTDGSGNLWYEEALPADCLFAVLVTVREGLRLRGQSSNGKEPDPLRVLRENVRFLARVQIGGNETVGQGAAWWSLET